MVDDRTLILGINAEPTSEGMVSVPLLTRKLDATQRLLFNIASGLYGGGRRGPWKTEILQTCELMLVKLDTGSLNVVTRIPDQPSSLFPDLDTGRQSLARLGETLQAISQRDRDVLRRFFPDYGQRARTLNSALPLLPEEEADYHISIETSVGRVPIEAEMRPYVHQFTHEGLADLPEDAIATITGRLYLVQVDIGERRIGVNANKRRIMCYYPEEYEDMIRELVPGSLVEIEGLATVDEHGQVARIEDVFDARTVQLVPLHCTRIIYDRRFHLRERILISVDFRDDLWTHGYEPLGILGYGKSRADSLNAFRMDFAACWDSIAQEDDANLTADAQELKRKLLALVDRVDEFA